MRQRGTCQGSSRLLLFCSWDCWSAFCEALGPRVGLATNLAGPGA